MPLDDYASAGGGALRIKGAKVTKKKKKKDKGNLQKALSGGDGSLVKADQEDEGPEKKRKSKQGEGKAEEEEEEESDRPVVKKTEAERRLEELKRKRVSYPPGFRDWVAALVLTVFNSSSRWRKIPSRGQSF